MRKCRAKEGGDKHPMGKMYPKTKPTSTPKLCIVINDKKGEMIQNRIEE